MANPLSVVMLGASGAVGGQVVSSLLAMPQLAKLTLLGRREIDLPADASHLARRAHHCVIKQHLVDVGAPESYAAFIPGHNAAVCTLGVGQPSKMSHSEFAHIDKDLVIAFATLCKQSGVRHFELLGAVGANAQSRSFYLRIKGELKDALTALDFERLSVFQPSMILTPTNRYGLSQALTLATWPALSHLMVGPMRKFRGVRVETLGAAMAHNLATRGAGLETLHWDAFTRLASLSKPQ
jgi:uncharacterized protein YbjT (DUF2867 family)